MRSPRWLAGEGNQCEGSALQVIAEGWQHSRSMGATLTMSVSLTP